MRTSCAGVFGTFALGIVVLAIAADQALMAAERTATTQPMLIPGGRYTRLLGAAPLKPPVLFADDDEAVAAKMETVNWYRYGAPTYAYYRGFGGWYGPWYGYRSYPYWGGYYGGLYGTGGYYGAYYGAGALYGAGAFYGSPYGFYGYNPIGYSYPYAVGYRPWGAYPFYTSAYYPPYMGGGAFYYPPYGIANYGGCCYW